MLTLLLLAWLSSFSEHPVPPDPMLLLGRWEVVEYSEQGIQVNKKSDPLAQAVRVYQHVRRMRARQWYGFDEEYERRTRAYERWEERDSLREVRRVAEAIALPYYAVFFADSTLACYNKDAVTGLVSLPESRRYVFSPGTMGLDITLPGGYGKWSEAQVLALDARRLTLFIPEDGEIVELVRAEGGIP